MNRDGRDSDEGLVRAIGPRALGLSIINLTVGGGIFVLPGLIAAQLGPAAILAYLACSVAVALVFLCFAEIGSRITRSGGAYAYIEDAFGPFAGFIASVLIWFGWSVLSDAAITVAMVETMAVALPTLARTGAARDRHRRLVRVSRLGQRHRRPRGSQAARAQYGGQTRASAAARRRGTLRHRHRLPVDHRMAVALVTGCGHPRLVLRLCRCRGRVARQRRDHAPAEDRATWVADGTRGHPSACTWACRRSRRVCWDPSSRATPRPHWPPWPRRYSVTGGHECCWSRV